MKLKNLSRLLIVVVVAGTGCSSCHVRNSQKRESSIDVSDAKFAFKNISSTKFVEHFVYDEKQDELFADPTKTKALVLLTDSERLKLLGPMMGPMFKEPPSYAVKLITAWYVAKQNKIGAFTPVVIHAECEHDYWFDAMVLLNANNGYVDGTALAEGPNVNDGDPEADLVSVWKAYADLGATIKCYRLIKTTYKDHNKRALIDSAVYQVEIAANGHFTKKQISSKQYTL
ncbi:hypothetical protein C8P68_104462 [Mucilaginibacter yixingensis]|uniref:Uncharacterized protein n=1 Tax=Mucilaginibacter yixingensis TaxID=1295612 RepID=A0A2T5JA82_9SPHI|nr:hypothetical protein [Mucilaginibacter yixingensis]PTQ96968.1 hypothetical protein C8P68_104462 [Mucilaginibacter yixingensis]